MAKVFIFMCHINTTILNNIMEAGKILSLMGMEKQHIIMVIFMKEIS